MTIVNTLRRQQSGTSQGRYATWRRRVPHLELLLCCVALAAIPFATAFGDIIADTKFELAINPGGWLSGAFTLWNSQQFGVLLNQAVGYLFPMGPFFVLLKLVGITGWVIQRLWLSALLIAAFGGTVRLLLRLGVGTPRTRLAGGLAYALSPIALGMLGQTSGEFLPMAMLPWIIIPLTDMRPWAADPDAGRRAVAVRRARAVARSAVAIGLASGMNAASTIAVILPAFLYLMTRPGARTKGRMLAWWAPAVVLATASWSVPLVLLSKYGVSIVPFTESAQVTTTTTSLLNILRGTESWIGYQTTNGQPDHPLAFLLSVDILPAALTGLLAALGVAGLVYRGLPERRFLLWTLLGGTVILALGYVSSLGNPLEGPLIGLINGPASPFRNLWKFDPMIRLPLAAGLTHLLAAGWASRRRIAAGVAAGIALATLAVPAVTVGVASPGSFSQVPGYWVAAADWLNVHAGNQAVLLEPASSFGEYTWGSPMDDVLAGLTSVDWASRSLEVVGSPGNERLLNAIDQQLAAGDGSAGLTATLARMGVKYIIVRNDLSANELDGTYPARVHDAIADSAGLTLAAQFGPATGGGSPDDAIADFNTKYPAVQIYQVAGAQAAAVIQPTADTLRVYGGPEALITLANEKLLGGGPVLVNNDGAGQPVAASVVTDSLRRRVVNFGELRTNFSPTLAAGQVAQTFLSADDFTEPAWDKYEAVAQYTGIKSMTASSSASDITAFPTQWTTAGLPYAAFDGNASTAWESAAFDGPVNQWIQGTFDAPVRFKPGATIKVAFDENPTVGPPVTQVTVSTAAGKVTEPVQVTGKPQPLRVPAGASGWLRITVTGLENQSITPLFGTQVGITSIAIPGVAVTRAIVAPPVAGPDPAAVVLAKAQPSEAGCMLTSVRWVCSPELSSTTEEQYGFDEAFSEATPAQARLSGSVVLPDPALIDQYAFPFGKQPTVTASSAYTADPQDQAWDAFDGNTATTWTAAPNDPHPNLAISWGQPRTVSRITITRPPGASGLTQVVIAGSAGQLRGAQLGKSAVISFKPMKTTSLTLTFTTDQAPLQVSEVKIPGVRPLRTPTKPLRLACGLGPQLAVDGKTVPTAVTGTYAELLNGLPLHYSACGQVALAAGSNTVTESAADVFDIQDAVLETAGPASKAAAKAVATAPAPVAADVTSWTSARRTVAVAVTARSYLEVNENYNAGWHAVLNGRALEPVQLDGWKQAWVLPAGASGVVTLTYQPAAVYRAAVIGGLAALLLCFVLALALSRRNRAEPLPWTTATAPGWLSRRLGQRYTRVRRWLTVAIVAVVIAGTGLLLGGWPGAIGLPIVTALFSIRVRGKRLGPLPAVAGGLLFVAAVIGAIGEHLAFSADSGWLVTATSDAIPQVICLIVIAGLIAALCLAKTETPE
jgi:arabinofuranan 3-O-arabinosyltransferase